MSEEPNGAGSSAGGSVVASGAGAFAVGGDIFSAESIALAAAVTIYSKAFLETLGKRSGEGVADLSKHLSNRLRTRKKGKPDETVIGVPGVALAMIVVTEDLPDEALIAMIDHLDVTPKRSEETRFGGTPPPGLASGRRGLVAGQFGASRPVPREVSRSNGPL